MRLEKYLIAFIIFGLVVTIGLLMMVDINTNYGTDLNDSDFDSGNFTSIVDKMYDTGDDIKDKALPSNIEEESFIITLVKGSFRAIKQVTSTFSIFVTGLENIITVLGIPPIFARAAYAILIISVIFALIYLFMNVQIK